MLKMVHISLIPEKGIFYCFYFNPEIKTFGSQLRKRVERPDMNKQRGLGVLIGLLVKLSP